MYIFYNIYIILYYILYISIKYIILNIKIFNNK